MMRARGFTLIELLVSISIFAVLGLSSYRMLQTVSDSNDTVRASVDAYSRMNLALSTIQRDLNQFAPRQVRDEYGDFLPPIVFESDDYVVEFTRRGWNNPAGRARSRMQRVAYSLDFEEEVLTRHSWTVLDRAEDAEPVSQVLLEGVTDFRVTGFTGEEPTLDTDFSLGQESTVAPLAVEVVIATNALGETQRLFQLVDPYQASGAVNEGPGDDNDGTGDDDDGTGDDDDGTGDDGNDDPSDRTDEPGDTGADSGIEEADPDAN